MSASTISILTEAILESAVMVESNRAEGRTLMQSQGRRAALTSGLIAFLSAFVLVVGIGMAVMGASGYGRPTGAPTTPSASPSTSPSTSTTTPYSPPPHYCASKPSKPVKRANDQGVIETATGSAAVPADWLTEGNIPPVLAFTDELASANHADSSQWDQMILVGTLSWPASETKPDDAQVAQRLLNCAATDMLPWTSAGSSQTITDDESLSSTVTVDGTTGQQARALVTIGRPTGTSAEVLEVTVTLVDAPSGTFVMVSVINPEEPEAVEARDAALASVKLR